MSKLDIKDIICRPYCVFYKEGEKEELECQGALVVEDLFNTGKLQAGEIPKNKKKPMLWEDRDNILETVCDSCPFKKEDCDFQSENRPAGCEPCGGYILLSILISNGIIKPEDIEEITA